MSRYVRQRSLSFGKWIKDSRKTAKLSQRQLAEKLEISHQLVSKMEKIGLVPLSPRLEDLCQALRVPVEEAKRVILKSIVTDVPFSNMEDISADELKTLVKIAENLGGRITFRLIFQALEEIRKK